MRQQNQPDRNPRPHNRPLQVIESRSVQPREPRAGEVHHPPQERISGTPRYGSFGGVESEAQTTVGEREDHCGGYSGPVAHEGVVDGGVHVRDGLGGAAGGGKGFPVVEDDVPATDDTVPGGEIVVGVSSYLSVRGRGSGYWSKRYDRQRLQI